eukprot:1036227-Rhodomonas_salina.3
MRTQSAAREAKEDGRRMREGGKRGGRRRCLRRDPEEAAAQLEDREGQRERTDVERRFDLRGTAGLLPAGGAEMRRWHQAS